jgi:hypothetical protein
MIIRHLVRHELEVEASPRTNVRLFMYIHLFFTVSEGVYNAELLPLKKLPTIPH